MPNIKSAEKRVLVSKRRNIENKVAISEMKTAIKKFNNAIDVNNIEEAERLLPITMSVIDSAAAKNMIHKNNAANKKASISKRLSDIKSGKLVITVKKDNKTIAAEKAKAAQETRDKLRKEIQDKKEEAAAAKAKAAEEKLAAEKAAKKAPKAKAKKADAIEATEAPKKPAAAKKPTASKKPAEKKEDKAE